MPCNKYINDRQQMIQTGSSDNVNDDDCDVRLIDVVDFILHSKKEM